MMMMMMMITMSHKVATVMNNKKLNDIRPHVPGGGVTTVVGVSPLGPGVAGDAGGGHSGFLQHGLRGSYTIRQLSGRFG